MAKANKGAGGNDFEPNGLNEPRGLVMCFRLPRRGDPNHQIEGDVTPTVLGDAIVLSRQGISLRLEGTVVELRPGRMVVVEFPASLKAVCKEFFALEGPVQIGRRGGRAFQK